MQACLTRPRPIKRSTSLDYYDIKGRSPRTTGSARKHDSVILSRIPGHRRASRTRHIQPPRSPSSDTANNTSDDDIIGPITPPPILHELSVYSKSAKTKPKPYHRCGPNIIERLYGEECSGYSDSKNVNIQGDKRRLEKLTPAALAQAIIAIQADIEWRRVRALASALHVDALKQRSKFIGITVKSEAEAYADAVSEPVEKSIEALSSSTANELNDHSSIAAYERDVTSFVTADAEFDEVESFALTLLGSDDSSGEALKAMPHVQTENEAALGMEA